MGTNIIRNLLASPDCVMGPERFQRLKAVLARRQPDLTVLMDRVNKGHNFSAILRSCDAVGALEAHAVIPDGKVDVDHRASGGTKKWVYVHEHSEVGTAVEHLHGEGFTLLAAHPSKDALDFRDVDFTRPTALVLGQELLGLSEETLALVDGVVSISMMGMVESLNVSVAAAVILYEAQRQREAAGMYAASRLDPARVPGILFEWAYPRVAALYRRQGRPYPPLGPHGEILEGKD